jgi:hypothetical protein
VPKQELGGGGENGLVMMPWVIGNIIVPHAHLHGISRHAWSRGRRLREMRGMCGGHPERTVALCSRGGPCGGCLLAAASARATDGASDPMVLWCGGMVILIAEQSPLHNVLFRR